MKTQRFPNYTIGEDAYDAIVSVCSPYGRTAAVIGGVRALGTAQEAINAAVAGSSISITGFFPYGGEAAVEHIAALAANPDVARADMIFAVGGGKAIDTAKVLAQRSTRPLFTFPTIASTCAACTGLGILYHLDGSLREYSFSDVPAVHIFIHSGIIARAPRKYLWAGIGDTMAKAYECTVSGRGDELAYNEALGTAISPMCSAPLLRYGAEALSAADRGEVSEALEQIVCNVILSTGYVSNLVSIDLTTGLAHAMYNGFTMLPVLEKKGHLHGEVVSYGVQVLLAADAQWEELSRVRAFCRTLGLPTCLKDIDASMADLPTVTAKALSGIDVRKYPYPVTPEMICSAVEKLETMEAAV